MRQWVKKIIDQLEPDATIPEANGEDSPMSDELATLLFVLDTMNKHLIDFEAHPIRRVRENLDQMTRNLMHADREKVEKTLFIFRQFYGSYRLDETTFMLKTFEDFKHIIWEFADQMAEEVHFEDSAQAQISSSLRGLREAVESNSIEQLRAHSREFIDQFTEVQTRRDERKEHRMETFQRSFHQVKKQLLTAQKSLHEDHLTGAYNRKFFDEHLRKYFSMKSLTDQRVSLLVLDIDHFKKVNDTYGHQIGDFVIKECVRLMKVVFHREQDIVARIGGEEFAILLPDFNSEMAMKKVEEALNQIRKDVLVHEQHQIRFTVSMGLAELTSDETPEAWLKRADDALYESKKTGRDRCTVAKPILKIQAA